MNIEVWKKRKKELHLTIDEIAKKANLPKGSVQNIFAGYVSDPRSSTVKAIEIALGLNQQSEWTDEEKALGIGRHPTYLSEDELNWLELRSLIIEAHGEKYLDTVITMLTALTK